MKLAVAVMNDDASAPLSSQFGRAPMFLIHDIESGANQILDNAQSLNSAQGAGIQAAEIISCSGAEALIVEHCGPKAFRALSAAGIAIFYCKAKTVAEAMTAFNKGTLQAAELADVEGHGV